MCSSDPRGELEEATSASSRARGLHELQTQRREDMMSKTPGDAPEILSLKTLTVALVVYAYFAGWIYAFSYYRHFGISLNLLEIPLQHFYVFAYSAVDSWVGWVAVVVGFGLGLVLTIWRYGRWLALPMALIAFPIIFHIAYSQGQQDAVALRHDEGDTKVIRVQLKTALQEPRWARKLSVASESDLLRLIVQTKDDYYVLLQPLDESNELPLGATYRIRKEDVSAVAIEVPQVRIPGGSR